MTRKFLLDISLILAVLSFCSVAGFAQERSKQMATIPFTFVFEGAVLPPGTYEVDMMMDSGMLLLVDSKHMPVQGEAATLPLPLKGTPKPPELIFVNSAEGYTLVEVRTQKERRLLTSDYGHGKFIGQQLRTVPITAVAEKSAPVPQQVSTQGR
jgi:hypothetical protein